MTPQQFFDDIFLPLVVAPAGVLVFLLFTVRSIELYRERKYEEMDDSPVDFSDWKKTEEKDLVRVVVPFKRARTREEE